MVDLALNVDDSPVPRYEVAERQEISEHYLAQLFLRLRHAGLVESVRGPGGGYVLARHPDTITAGEVLRAVDETLSPVYCVSEDEEECPRVDGCPTHWLWHRLDAAIRDTLDAVSLAELCEHASTGQLARL
jgi:Rrf2 family protein